MSDDDFNILDLLAQLGETPSARLAHVLQLTETSITRRLKRLSHQGWCSRISSSDWELTLKGSIFVGITLSEKEPANDDTTP